MCRNFPVSSGTHWKSQGRVLPAGTGLTLRGLPGRKPTAGTRSALPGPGETSLGRSLAVSYTGGCLSGKTPNPSFFSLPVLWSWKENLVYLPHFTKKLRSRDIHNACTGTSLVAQWLRICLPMQGTRVPALVQEDPTCHGATKSCTTATEPEL